MRSADDRKSEEAIPETGTAPAPPEILPVPEDWGTLLGDGLSGTETPSAEELERFFQECATVVAERDEWKERCARVSAEYDNYRKRTAREREQLYTDVQRETVCRFLPLYDNLVRAAGSPTGDEAYRQGVELILKGLLDTLQKLNVTPVPALGEPFDPEWHDAVSHIEDETLSERTVAEVFQEGFMMGGRVVRHAAVKVAN